MHLLHHRPRIGGPTAAEGELEHRPNGLRRSPVVPIEPLPRLEAHIRVLDHRPLEQLTKEHRPSKVEDAQENHGPHQRHEAAGHCPHEDSELRENFHHTDDLEASGQPRQPDQSDEGNVAAGLAQDHRQHPKVDRAEHNDNHVEDIELLTRALVFIQEELLPEDQDLGSELKEEDRVEYVLRGLEKHLRARPNVFLRLQIQLNANLHTSEVQLCEHNDSIENDEQTHHILEWTCEEGLPSGLWRLVDREICDPPPLLLQRGVDAAPIQEALRV
mmetsp:Transcript_70967/g.178996  ORF Transcript_70967/g.178996 Transcript_70967/m.178996 type:complete len:273 (-) Transcript_70967:751-1569(-)